MNWKKLNSMDEYWKKIKEATRMCRKVYGGLRRIEESMITYSIRMCEKAPRLGRQIL